MSASWVALRTCLRASLHASSSSDDGPNTYFCSVSVAFVEMLDRLPFLQSRTEVCLQFLECAVAASSDRVCCCVGWAGCQVRSSPVVLFCSITSWTGWADSSPRRRPRARGLSCRSEERRVGKGGRWRGGRDQ